MAMEKTCGHVHSHLGRRNSVTVNRSRVDGREQKQQCLWCISDETRVKRLDVLVNSSVSPFDSVNVCLDGTPNSKRVNTRSWAKIISALR
jgi:hypothetical protein